MCLASTASRCTTPRQAGQLAAPTQLAAPSWRHAPSCTARSTHLLGCHLLYFTHLPAPGIDPRPAVFPPPLSSLPQFNVPNLRFLKQRALARLKLERIDQCASSQGGYIAEAKRVLAAAVHTASAQEAATVESRCGAGGQGAAQGRAGRAAGGLPGGGLPGGGLPGLPG